MWWKAEDRLDVRWKCFSRVSCSLTVWWRENGSCLTLTPCRKINSQRSELTSWRQAGMEKMLWGGHTPVDCTRRTNPSERKRWMVTDGNRSESGFLIFLLRPSSSAKGKKGWREGEWKRRGHGGELFRGPGAGAASGVKERQNFDSLSLRRRKNKISPSSLWNVPTQWKWKSVNSKDKCYRSSLSVRTSHMWFPGRIYHLKKKNLGPKKWGRRKCWSQNELTVFLQPQGLNVHFWLPLIGNRLRNMDPFRAIIWVLDFGLTLESDPP